MRPSISGWLLAWALIMGPGSAAWANGDDSWLPRAEGLFLHYCSHCHGKKGGGDGFNAENLDKEPAQLSDIEFISKKKNEQLFNVIKNGGLSVRKSHLMPPYGFTLSDGEIWSLVAYVRNLAGDDSQPVPPSKTKKQERSPNHHIEKKDVASFSKWFASEGHNHESEEIGELLFNKRKSCLACHAIEQEGGGVGPDLSRARFFYRPEWVYAWIKYPQEFRPESRMPNLGLSDEEARSITAFLSSLDDDDEDDRIPEGWTSYLKGEGDPEQGKVLFFDLEGKAACAKCHEIREKGGELGPDLSFIGSSRRPLFILESILNPKAVITAGYTAVLILTTEKKFITGIKKNEDDSGVDIVDKEGREMRIPMERIKKYKTENISIMPDNFKETLTVQEVKNILAFLKTLTLPVLASVDGK